MHLFIISIYLGIYLFINSNNAFIYYYYIDISIIIIYLSIYLLIPVMYTHKRNIILLPFKLKGI